MANNCTKCGAPHSNPAARLIHEKLGKCDRFKEQ
jgi:hypothetical protein